MNQGNSLKPYKNYVGTVEVNFEERYYYGYVQGTQFEARYEADTLDELQKRFEKCVDDYVNLINEGI